jgi:predicted negative regulator of RcsB-dependent stress response
VAHISRRDLKKDEIRETFAHGAEAVASHKELLWKLAIPVLVIALGVVAWRFYNERQNTKASAALADAMKVYDAQVRPAGQPAFPDELSYVLEKNKYEDAVKKLNVVAQTYPRTRPGQMARYYAALCAEHLGKNDEAEKSLKEIGRGGQADLAALARLELARFYDHNGKGDQAAPLYQQLLAKPSLLVPKPVVLLAMAEHYSKSNPQEAAKVYTQIKTEFPNTAMADEAEKRLAMLPGKT